MKNRSSLLLSLAGFMFVYSSTSLYAGAEYGNVPGKWALNNHGFRDKFIPVSGYGNGVYAVEGIFNDVVLALDTNGEGFAECRKVTKEQGLAQPIPIQNCEPTGPGCTAYPYKCSSELLKPIFIETNIRPTSSERLNWKDSINPLPAFIPLISSLNGKPPFYFERSCKPKALAGKILYHGAWITGPKNFQPGPDESVDKSH